MLEPRIPIDRDKIKSFCEKWKIVEFSLFGSVLRGDFGPDSDVDVLVTFDANAHWSLFDLSQMEDELSGEFRREVDLVPRRGLERSRNYLRRKAVLSSTYRVYGA